MQTKTPLSSSDSQSSTAVEIRVTGTVQGVGFRPFIFALAQRHTISGSVSNTGEGVTILAHGEETSLHRFIAAITTEAPPLSSINAVTVKNKGIFSRPPSGFHIQESTGGEAATASIPPDISLCDDCLRELRSTKDRRYGYPFINCTNCGPRFSIIENIPYDREKTSMKVFPMCDACAFEYHDPANRRFHAQPNACALCGPKVSWHDHNGNELQEVSPITEAAAALKAGEIVAIRGLGGFHLAIDATNPLAVATLRRRKNRPEKPLAVMVPDIQQAKKFCQLDHLETTTLLSPAHPIVLARKGHHSDLADTLCPGMEDIGIMLPYTPLHHLLFAQQNCPEALVMTSGNISGVPLCIDNNDAISRLSSIADHFLLHNRDILTRVDDSVVKCIADRPRLFRRARGFCPAPLKIAHDLPQSIACGGGLKSTFCLGRGEQAIISQHIGDLFSFENYTFFLESITHHRKVFAIDPECCIRDLHPDYMSSRYADSTGLPCYQVQHHHAHGVAVMAEHKITTPVLAIIFDGTGLGSDGNIWGGEFLHCGLTSFQRLAHLQYLPLPGGDKGTEEPWRMTLSALHSLYGQQVFDNSFLPSPLNTIEANRRETVLQMIMQHLNSPLTSSCGRLFDVIACLLDLRLFCSFEGQAAMELEALAAKAISSDWLQRLDKSQDLDVDLFLRHFEEKYEIISTEFVRMILQQRDDGIAPPHIALEFHRHLIVVVSELAARLCARDNLDTVVLAGGCMQNRILLEGLLYRLQRKGLKACTGKNVPVNDGGLSFGQLIIGGLQHVYRNSNAGN